MPLHDHFAELTGARLPWTSLLSSWAVRLASRLNQFWLPEEFVAVNSLHLGPDVEIPLTSDGVPVVVRATDSAGGPPSPSPAWEVPPPRATVPRTKGEYVEVRVHDRAQRWATAAAVVAFVTPTNKETLPQRRAFLSRCDAHLHQGSSLVVIDVVTQYPHCLYNDLLALLGAEGAPRLPDGTRLFAAAFRPVSRGERNRLIDPNERKEVDIWTEPAVVGHALPTLPLRLIYDDFVPVEFEAVYQEVLHSHRLA